MREGRHNVDSYPTIVYNILPPPLSKGSSFRHKSEIRKRCLQSRLCMCERGGLPVPGSIGLILGLG